MKRRGFLKAVVVAPAVAAAAGAAEEVPDVVAKSESAGAGFFGESLDHDAQIDYPSNAIASRDGVLYRAMVANGPGTSNATTPGTDAAVWDRISAS